MFLMHFRHEHYENTCRVNFKGVDIVTGTFKVNQPLTAEYWEQVDSCELFPGIRPNKNKRVGTSRNEIP